MEESSSSGSFHAGRCILWTFLGIPWLLLAFIRDSFEFWTSLYDNILIIEDKDVSLEVEELVNKDFIIQVQAILKNTESN
jgi:hypothetical protein